MRRRNISIGLGLIVVAVIAALLIQLPFGAGSDGANAAGKPLPGAAGTSVDSADRLTLNSGPAVMAMRNEFTPALQEAQVIHDRYAAAVAENVATADVVEAWGYERGEFETAAGTLLASLRADFPEEFAGAVLHPVLPQVIIGFVSDQSGIADRITASGFTYEYELRPGLLSIQDREALRNAIIAADLGLVGDQFFADPLTLALAPEDLAQNAPDIAQRLSGLLEVPQADLAAALTELAATAPGESYLAVGPLGIELQHPGDGITE